ncbi:hypothetical protein [Serratia sp. D1N4]
MSKNFEFPPEHVLLSDCIDTLSVADGLIDTVIDRTMDGRSRNELDMAKEKINAVKHIIEVLQSAR